MAEPKMTTTVSLDVSDVMWLKQNDVKIRSAVKAGIASLKGAPDRAALEAQICALRAEVGRRTRHSNMVHALFNNNPDVYREIERVIQQEEV